MIRPTMSNDFPREFFVKMGRRGGAKRRKLTKAQRTEIARRGWRTRRGKKK